MSIRFDDPKSLATFFDPSNKNHLLAYKHLHEVGWWPDTFQAEMRANKIEVPEYWENFIKSKIITAYITHMLENPNETD